MAGPEGGLRGVQLPLRTESLQKVYKFYPSVHPIYPEDGYAGAPTEVIVAEKIKRKIHGLTGYRSLTEVHLYHNQHHWQRSVGTVFGAYADKAHERKLETE